jgi:hypothetical protein
VQHLHQRVSEFHSHRSTSSFLVAPLMKCISGLSFVRFSSGATSPGKPRSVRTVRSLWHSIPIRTPILRYRDRSTQGTPNAWEPELGPRSSLLQCKYMGTRYHIAGTSESQHHTREGALRPFWTLFAHQRRLFGIASRTMDSLVTSSVIEPSFGSSTREIPRCDSYMRQDHRQLLALPKVPAE